MTSHARKMSQNAGLGIFNTLQKPLIADCYVYARTHLLKHQKKTNTIFVTKKTVGFVISIQRTRGSWQNWSRQQISHQKTKITRIIHRRRPSFPLLFGVARNTRGARARKALKHLIISIKRAMRAPTSLPHFE